MMVVPFLGHFYRDPSFSQVRRVCLLIPISPRSLCARRPSPLFFYGWFFFSCVLVFFSFCEYDRWFSPPPVFFVLWCSCSSLTPFPFFSSTRFLFSYVFSYSFTTLLPMSIVIVRLFALFFRPISRKCQDFASFTRMFPLFLLFPPSFLGQHCLLPFFPFLFYVSTLPAFFLK